MAPETGPHADTCNPVPTTHPDPQHSKPMNSIPESLSDLRPVKRSRMDPGKQKHTATPLAALPQVEADQPLRVTTAEILPRRSSRVSSSRITSVAKTAMSGSEFAGASATGFATGAGVAPATVGSATVDCGASLTSKQAAVSSEMAGGLRSLKTPQGGGCSRRLRVLATRASSSSAKPSTSTQEATGDERTCWLCLESDEALEQPCKCPRYAHSICLARWQLRCAGGRQESYCRFCEFRLPDWRQVLPSVARANVEIRVVCSGKIHRLIARPGDDYSQFQEHVWSVCGLSAGTPLELSFNFNDPFTGYCRPSLDFCLTIL